MILMPEIMPRLLSNLPSSDASQMLHSWWLAESHLDRLLAQYHVKAQDLEKHRDVAVTYVKYFEDSVLPLRDLSAPEGTRVQRVEELDGYRSGSLVHFDKLKAWLYEEEYRLNFIKAHLAFALAMLQNKQGKATNEEGLATGEYQALRKIMEEHSKALLQWRDDEHRSGRLYMNKEEEVELIKVGGQQLMKTALAGADGDETSSASQQLQQVKGRNTELQRFLQDEQLAKESQMEEVERLLKEIQKMQDERDQARQQVRVDRRQAEQEMRLLHREKSAAVDSTRRTERIAIQQALELQTAHNTNSTLAEINDTLQGQVANLQNDNQSFQTRVTALQDTTTSLSAQIGALAKQAQTAANAANQLQVLRGVAHTLQNERDSARTVIIAMQQDKIAANDEMMALQTDLNMANTQVNSLLDENRALLTSYGKPAGMSTGAEGSPVAANESGEHATIAELRVRLQQAEENTSVFAQGMQAHLRVQPVPGTVPRQSVPRHPTSPPRFPLLHLPKPDTEP
ncbi:hypothetical protein WJX77_006844 [Trebouxia sp. C0004]